MNIKLNILILIYIWHVKRRKGQSLFFVLWWWTMYLDVMPKYSWQTTYVRTSTGTIELAYLHWINQSWQFIIDLIWLSAQIFRLLMLTCPIAPLYKQLKIDFNSKYLNGKIIALGIYSWSESFLANMYPMSFTYSKHQLVLSSHFHS